MFNSKIDNKLEERIVFEEKAIEEIN